MIRRGLPWMAALALGVLGWFAMMPVWTQGLGLCALDGDGQPGLWLAAAKMALALGGGFFILRGLVALDKDSVFTSALPRSHAFGMGLYVAALILALAMAGQPLRSWFLLELSRNNPTHPLVWIGCSFVACLATLLTGGGARGFLRRTAAAIGCLAFLLLASQLGGLGSMAAVLGGVSFHALTSRGVIPLAARWKLLRSAGYLGALVVLMSSGSQVQKAVCAGVLGVVLLVALGWKHKPRFVPWAEAACCLGVVAINLPVANERLMAPTAQDWLVLAFALGCGFFAAMIRCCVKCSPQAAPDDPK
ncbi:hypothetical protein [Fundidesulfovibrio terrae]|uniref:hypothetical protein n=1 Tax=Fundidesulfovibrio terrae TaxID=2922866 RepID=UPI001FAF7045|nr:hypothetical protein [Fundidesulfovibrio terrae]